jgi:oligopeptide transport system permease protein
VTVDYYKYSWRIDDDVYFMFGTDYLGRDLWTRVWRGARISLVIAIRLGDSATLPIGLIYGSIAGYYGGSIDMVMMRITEIINAMPDRRSRYAVHPVLWKRTALHHHRALVVQNWIGTARMIRAQFYRFKNQ